MKIPDQKKAHVLKQIDFYFSDSNLPFDKFLKGECQAEGGWVDLSVVIAFARVQSLLGKEWKGPDAVTDDAIQLVSNIMKESTIVEISDDQYQIRRKDMPTDWTEVIAAVAARTIHVALLPFDTTIEKLEMSSTEEATAMLSNKLEYEGATLRVQCKADYEEAMVKVREEKKDVRTLDVQRPMLTVEGLPPDPQVEKAEDEPDQKAEARDKDKADDQTEEKPPAETPVKSYVVKDDEKGQLVSFEIVGTDEGLPVGRGLRDELGGQAKGIRFVDRSAGTPTGVIRCIDAAHAQTLMKDCNEAGELESCSGHKFRLSMITGDEEVAVWTRIHAAAAERATKRPARGGHSGRGGGGRQTKRGRR